MNERNSPVIQAMNLLPNSRVLRWLWIPVLLFAFIGSFAAAQTRPAAVKPYAAMNPNAVYYSGTGGGSAHDLRGRHVTIGMMLPLTGPFAAEGKSLFHAAQLALDEENKTPLPDGQRLALAARDESGPWGQASDEIVHLILEDNAVAIITSPDGAIAHQAEQVANKIGVPVVTLASDVTTTQINMPWIFRLGPSDRDEAAAFARDIYAKRGLRNILLIAETDHDGRAGAVEFERAARELGAAAPVRVNLPLSPEGIASFAPALKPGATDAVVLWADAEAAEELIPRIRQTLPQTPIYLCRKAAEFAAPVGRGESVSAQPLGNDPQIWISTSRLGTAPSQRQFEQDFMARAGIKPGEADAAVYDAIRVIASALRRAGANRVRVRDVLASGRTVTGATGTISFDSAGNEYEHMAVIPYAVVVNAQP